MVARSGYGLNVSYFGKIGEPEIALACYTETGTILIYTILQSIISIYDAFLVVVKILALRQSTTKLPMTTLLILPMSRLMKIIALHIQRWSSTAYPITVFSRVYLNTKQPTPPIHIL